MRYPTKTTRNAHRKYPSTSTGSSPPKDHAHHPAVPVVHAHILPDTVHTELAADPAVAVVVRNPEAAVTRVVESHYRTRTADFGAAREAGPTAVADVGLVVGRSTAGERVD